ncbi:ricin B lectin domain-containing protein [Halteromyces radiatus]|uniref:ricin B lectin domain-containing protein n=1 Tax=Halteromyces radiatus TaxID=101107 RepID=UPI00221F8B87|nr:ricin B lectin domain-containing protein [Halteromyces radiatus]KAI8096635.1 ricin B lectin domain-containing protein [Halteromyces radiatus]
MNGFPLDTYFYIKNRKNSTVLDVYDGATTEDANIVLWPQKMNDNHNQLWRYEDGFLLNMKSKLALDVRGGDLKAETHIVQYGRKITMAHNQRFGYRDGYLYTLADPRLVFDIKGGSDKDGAKLILNKRRHHSHEDQQWTIEPFDTSSYSNPYQ